MERWIQNKEAFPYIKQLPNFCVMCCIENMLKYHGCKKFNQKELLGLLRPGEVPGFKEFRKLLSEILPEFSFVLKESKQADNDTPEKAFKNIKATLDEGIPVAVSFKPRDQNGNPVSQGAHIKVAVAYDDTHIKFFEPEPDYVDFTDYDINNFKLWVNADHHLLIIKKQ